MDETKFWSVIEAANGDARRVKEALVVLKPEEIVAFSKLYWEKHNALHRWDIWGAAFVASGGCSDDGFHYFKAFAIGKGRAFYEGLLSDPDSIGGSLSEEDAETGFDNESLNYAAAEAYESIADEELDDESNEGEEPVGEPWSEDDLPRLFPKLWDRFGEVEA